LSRQAKQKGRLGQQEVRDAILNLFPDLEKDDVRSTAMGQNGEDIQLSPKARELLPLSIEVKRRKDLKTVYEWMDQAKQGDWEPVVCFRGDRKDWLTIVSMDHYLTLLKAWSNHGKQ
jgi:hypothetical protein